MLLTDNTRIYDNIITRVTTFERYIKLIQQLLAQTHSSQLTCQYSPFPETFCRKPSVHLHIPQPPPQPFTYRHMLLPPLSLVHLLQPFPHPLSVGYVPSTPERKQEWLRLHTLPTGFGRHARTCTHSQNSKPVLPVGMRLQSWHKNALQG